MNIKKLWVAALLGMVLVMSQHDIGGVAVP